MVNDDSTQINTIHNNARGLRGVSKQGHYKTVTLYTL